MEGDTVTWVGDLVTPGDGSEVTLLSLSLQRRRSQTYVQALSSWLRGDSGDSEDLGDLGDVAECPPVPSPLTKAHSSPSLVPEPPPRPPGRVRRHISERRATRGVPKGHPHPL